MKRLMPILVLISGSVYAEVYNGIIDADNRLVTAGFISTAALSNELQAGWSVVTNVPRGSITTRHDREPTVTIFTGGVYSVVAKVLNKVDGGVNSRVLQAERNLLDVIDELNTELIDQGYLTDGVSYTGIRTGVILANGVFPTNQLYLNQAKDMEEAIADRFGDLDRKVPGQKQDIKDLRDIAQDLEQTLRGLKDLLCRPAINAIWALYSDRIGQPVPP